MEKSNDYNAPDAPEHFCCCRNHRLRHGLCRWTISRSPSLGQKVELLVSYGAAFWMAISAFAVCCVLIASECPSPYLITAFGLPLALAIWIVVKTTVPRILAKVWWFCEKGTEFFSSLGESHKKAVDQRKHDLNVLRARFKKALSAPDETRDEMMRSVVALATEKT